LEAPLIRLGKTQVQIWVCPRRQKWRLITSQRLLVTTFWGEAMSLRFRERGRSTCYAKLFKTPLRVNGGLSFSQEIVTTEVKGWITKNSVPKWGDPQENRCIIHHST
jgi:hypothetical protein